MKLVITARKVSAFQLNDIQNRTESFASHCNNNFLFCNGMWTMWFEFLMQTQHAAVDSGISLFLQTLLVFITMVTAWNGDGCVNFLFAIDVFQVQIHSLLLFSPQTILINRHSERWRSLRMETLNKHTFSLSCQCWKRWLLLFLLDSE